jgi:hypothetical protein
MGFQKALNNNEIFLGIALLEKSFLMTPIAGMSEPRAIRLFLWGE